MKATREERRLIDRLRSRLGKRNGVVSSVYLDHPALNRAMNRRMTPKAPEVPL